MLTGVNPFTRYIQTGWKEGKDPHPMFDTSFYLDNYPAVKELGQNPLIIMQLLSDGNVRVFLSPISAGDSSGGQSHTGGDLEDVDTSIPGISLEDMRDIDFTAFPQGDDFLRKILDGQYEFPADGEGGTYFLSSTGNSDIINDDSFWDDTPGILNPEAEDIANGHAFPDHKHQFPGIETKEDFAEKIDQIMNDPTVKRKENLDNDRRAYWEDSTGTLVIVDPNDPDGGTMFKPDEGKEYFNGLE